MPINCSEPTHRGLPDLSSLEYDPQQFRNIYETELGLAIWQFLVLPDNVIRMQTATDLGRPAIEAIEAGLLSTFGPSVAEDRVKQCIGHAVHQVMKARGYHIDRQNIRITRKRLFTSGTRYRSNAELVGTMAK
jgi:hypothetical protein